MKEHKQDDHAEIGKRFEMSITDLEQINENRSRAFKVREGILWHLRLIHTSKQYLEIAAKFLPDMKGVTFNNEIEDCLDCKLGKSKRKPFNETRKRATKVLQVIHADVMGAITPCSFRSGCKYIVTFTDDYSRYALAYAIPNKMSVHSALRDYINEVRELINDHEPRTISIHNCNEGQTFKCKIGKLHTDNGTEYKTTEMKQFLNQEKIKWDPCFPRTPQHNGCAERLNLEIEEKIRTILTSARCLNIFGNMPLST